MTELRDGPVLSTIGVNPDILQFYLSIIDHKINILQGSFHHWYISGILSEISPFGETPFLTLSVPFFHMDIRNLYFGLPADLLQNSSSSISQSSSDLNMDGSGNGHYSTENTKELAHYAYVFEVDPLPRFPHPFECME